jgi:kinesin family protein 2/24
MNGDLQNGIPGLYILGAHDIFGIQSHPQHQKLKVYVSFFEIYCGKLFDLLNNRN